MAIAVLDQGAELYWFVSNALLQDELPLKHLNSIQAGETYILQELPKIVILNGDDQSIQAEKFIARMRNHVFARYTYFIVFTADPSYDHRKDLVVAGASQVLFRGRGHNPSPKFFRNTVKWLMDLKNPDPQLFDYKPVPFPSDAEFVTFGRMGWVSASHCLLEVNLDISPGQTIDIHSSLFDELGIKNPRVTCVEKNKVGRYYQYANSVLCKLETKDPTKDSAKLSEFIKMNQKLSKYKSIKVLYYEDNYQTREHIRGMIKTDQRYCARGFVNFDNFNEDLNKELPQLILVNRLLIKKDKAKFEALKSFLKTRFCYCVTYDKENLTNIEEFKKNYDFAMHSPSFIETDLLDSMIKKLEEKMFKNLPDESQKRIYFNKHSPDSKMSLHLHCKVTEIGVSGLGVELKIPMSPYCAFQITSSNFSFLGIHHLQYARNFLGKKTKDLFYHQCVFLGQTYADNEVIRIALDQIKELGFDKWKESK